MAEVVSLGEILIDMMPVEDAENVYRAIPGGAPANFLTQVHRLGHAVSFISTVGRDHFGEAIIAELHKNAIDTTHVKVSDTVPTTLAFVHHDADGDRSFSFYRNPGADLMTTLDDADRALIAGARVLHVGTLSMVEDPARTATLDALAFAQEHGVRVSFDPNFRENLWQHKDEMVDAAKVILPYVHIAKISLEEVEWICGGTDLEQNVRTLFALAPLELLTVTNGNEDALAITRHAHVRVPAFAVPAVDTTGCGDAFGGTMLASVLDAPKPLATWNEADLRNAVRRGNAAGAITATRQGAMPALPTDAEIQTFLVERA
ncbi:MAG: carbohydrate kinase [Peptoniphilaceae bacterium]|nr:carbohydrate kinase [Peptoniphilaceae bacterium]